MEIGKIVKITRKSEPKTYPKFEPKPVPAEPEKVKVKVKQT